MNCFFFRLPTDLQLYVFKTWLFDDFDDGKALVQSLSAMDVACCNQASRPHFLDLACHPVLSGPPCRESNINVVAGQMAITDSPGYCRWLHSRKISIASIYLTDAHVQQHLAVGRSPFKLPSITTVFLEHGRPIGSSQGVLRLFPNLSTLIIRSSRSAGSLNNVLPAVPPLPLKTIVHHVGPSGLEPRHHTSGLPLCLEVFDSSLYVLGANASHTDFLLSCNNLKAISASFDTAHSMSAVLKVLDACVLLSDLTLYHCKLFWEIADINTILQAGKHLRRFQAFHSFKVGNNSALYAHFAGLLKNSTLDCLSLGNCSFDRGQQSLTIGIAVKDEILELGNIVRACLPLRKLTVSLLDLPGLVFSATLGGLIGASLVELVLNNQSALASADVRVDKEQFPLHCPLLRRLTMININVADAFLQELSTRCKFLECFWLRNRKSEELSDRQVSDIGLMALFAGCRELKVLTVLHAPLATFTSLEAIVEHKLLLAKFTWRQTGFGQDDVLKFQRLAKQRNLLPVPTMVQEREVSE